MMKSNKPVRLKGPRACTKKELLEAVYDAMAYITRSRLRVPFQLRPLHYQVRVRMRNCGIPQADLARRAGIPQPALALWLTGKGPLPPRHRRALASILGCRLVTAERLA